MTEPVQTGIKFGVGFFIGVFILAPLLLIGGCALLLAGSEDDPPPPARVAPVSAALLEDLSDRARTAVGREGAQPVSATCRDRGFQREEFVPDYHLIACVVTARAGGATVRFRQRVECFAKRPTLDACHADDPVRA